VSQLPKRTSAGGKFRESMLSTDDRKMMKISLKIQRVRQLEPIELSFVSGADFKKSPPGRLIQNFESFCFQFMA
jgi:hypothetical protein